MNDIVWKNPPPRQEPRWRQVLQQLAANPGEWALIKSGPIQFNPWWGPLTKNPSIEVRYVPTTKSLLGPTDVYMRYVR